MPWDAKSFRKHNSKLDDEQLKVAAEIANSVLARTGDEGRAVRTANGAFTGENADKKSEKLHAPGSGYAKKAENDIRKRKKKYQDIMKELE